MNIAKKYIRITLGVLTAIIGFVFFFIPFLPFGYIFLFISAFYLATYIPILKKFKNYLRTKDKKGYIEKVETKIKQFEDWIYKKISKER